MESEINVQKSVQYKSELLAFSGKCTETLAYSYCKFPEVENFICFQCHSSLVPRHEGKGKEHLVYTLYVHAFNGPTFHGFSVFQKLCYTLTSLVLT